MYITFYDNPGLYGGATFRPLLQHGSWLCSEMRAPPSPTAARSQRLPACDESLSRGFRDVPHVRP